MSEDKAELLIEVGKSYVTLGGERHDASDGNYVVAHYVDHH